MKSKALVPLTLVLLLLGASLLGAQSLPRYEPDPLWVKLPDRWVVGSVGAVCMGPGDHVVIVNRQGLSSKEFDAGILAPPVIEFDAQGTVVNSWGDPAVLGEYLHDCHVDKDWNIWIIGARSGFAQKFSRDGKLLMQIGKSGVFDSSDGTDKGKPLNSSSPQFFGPGGIDVDPQTGEIYVADGEAANVNARVAVLDSKGNFLRQWPLNRTAGEANIPPVLHCLRLANDLVYVCDRRANRVQVFDKMGNFKGNIDVPWKLYTPADGQRRVNSGNSAVGLDFSRDPERQFMYVVNQTNMQVDVIDRQSRKVVGVIGRGAGNFPGQLNDAHRIAVDSMGNVYVGEDDGHRLQRFKVAGQ
jgi:DNA-binding beta-propeller fold protein YncE